MKIVNVIDLPFVQADITVLSEQSEESSTESKVFQKGYLSCLKNVQKQINEAPAAAVIPVSVVKEYLLGLIKEWEELSDDRRYDSRNMCVYNHVRAELDSLEKYCRGNNLN